MEYTFTTDNFEKQSARLRCCRCWLISGLPGACRASMLAPVIEEIASGK